MLAVFGLTINIVVLFSLIMAVGMLVDGAIVVTEFADRRMQEGVGRKEAYREATKRMAWPIIASTSTTLAAFAPLLFGLISLASLCSTSPNFDCHLVGIIGNGTFVCAGNGELVW